MKLLRDCNQEVTSWLDKSKYVPNGHSMQVLLAVVLVKLPGSQTAQAVAFTPDWWNPASHSTWQDMDKRTTITGQQFNTNNGQQFLLCHLLSTLCPLHGRILCSLHELFRYSLSLSLFYHGDGARRWAGMSSAAWRAPGGEGLALVCPHGTGQTICLSRGRELASRAGGFVRSFGRGGFFVLVRRGMLSLSGRHGRG